MNTAWFSKNLGGKGPLDPPLILVGLFSLCVKKSTDACIQIIVTDILWLPYACQIILFKNFFFQNSPNCWGFTTFSKANLESLLHEFSYGPKNQNLDFCHEEKLCSWSKWKVIHTQSNWACSPKIGNCWPNAGSVCEALQDQVTFWLFWHHEFHPIFIDAVRQVTVQLPLFACFCFLRIEFVSCVRKCLCLSDLQWEILPFWSFPLWLFRFRRFWVSQEFFLISLIISSTGNMNVCRSSSGQELPKGEYLRSILLMPTLMMMSLTQHVQKWSTCFSFN